MSLNHYKRGDKLFFISGTEGTTAHNYAERLKNLLLDKHGKLVCLEKICVNQNHIDFGKFQAQLPAAVLLQLYLYLLLQIVVDGCKE